MSSFQIIENKKSEFFQANISILIIELLCFNVIYPLGIRVHEDDSEDPTTHKPLLAKPILSTSNETVNNLTTTLIENRTITENRNTS